MTFAAERESERERSARPRTAGRRTAVRLGCALGVAVAMALAGCKRAETEPTVVPASAGGRADFTVLAGSELRDIEAPLVEAARAGGVNLKISYAGALDIVERVNAGERFDAILPASGAYPSLALTTKPLASDKLFYSRVALGVKAAKLRELGWDRAPPTWADIAKAAAEGRLRYAMTNPTSSNSGMSALFAVASAVAGKTEDLSAEEVDAKVLTGFLSGQKLTAGSSGWLAEAYAKDPSALDAMVNYEAVLLRTNEKLAEADRLTPVYPKDGVISADYPLMLLNAARRDDHTKLVAALKAAPLQRRLAHDAFLRPAIADVPLASGLSAAPVAELSFPNRLAVIDAVLSAYQGEWRRPATSIFVLDTSGSMRGGRLEAMRHALTVLAGADASVASARYARFQNRERVVLLTFSDVVNKPVRVDFNAAQFESAQHTVLAYADNLAASGGTAIYAAIGAAEEIARRELASDAGRYVSIVLLTDGENTSGPDLDAFRAGVGAHPSARVFPILFGEASNTDMAALAQLTGGRTFDGRKASLALVFREIRGYQ